MIINMNPLLANWFAMTSSMKEHYPAYMIFLYLDEQPKLGVFLKAAGLSLQDTNLSAFNQYIDMLGNTYNNFSAAPKVTLEGLPDFVKNAWSFLFLNGRRINQNFG